MNNNIHTCIAVADVHGNKEHYKKLLMVAKHHNASAIFLCGDLLPKNGGSWHPENKIRTIQMQRTFINNFFKDFLKDLSKISNIYAIYGNDDFKSTYAEVANTGSEIIFLDNEVTLINKQSSIHIAGYPYVPITPFLHKDWEKWDNTVGDVGDKTYKTSGFLSVNDTHEPIDFLSSTYNNTTIADDVEKLALISDPTKTIYLMHAPPYNTPLDMVSADNPFLKNANRHVGSVAVRNFIETHNPLLTLHGHIHESMSQSGEYLWEHDKSISANPSHNFKSDQLTYLLFDLQNVSGIRRLSI